MAHETLRRPLQNTSGSDKGSDGEERRVDLLRHHRAHTPNGHHGMPGALGAPLPPRFGRPSQSQNGFSMLFVSSVRAALSTRRCATAGVIGRS